MMVSSDKMQLWGGVMTQRVGGYMANLMVYPNDSIWLQWLNKDDKTSEKELCKTIVAETNNGIKTTTQTAPQMLWKTSQVQHD